MCEYKFCMDSLTLDGDFKNKLLGAMLEEADRGGKGRDILANMHRKSAGRVAVRAALSAACVGVLSIAVIPVVIAMLPAGNAAPNDEMTGNTGSDSAQAAVIPIGERAVDKYGNSITFAGVDYALSLSCGENTYLPGEGNVFILLSVQLDLTHEWYSGYVDITDENTCACGYVLGEDYIMSFREDIFEETFSKSDGRPYGEGELVLEVDGQFLNAVRNADPEEINGENFAVFFECADFGVEGDRQSKIQTSFYLSLAEFKNKL